MDVYSAIKARKTIRDFQDKAVPMEIIEKIIDAGLAAPTNDHMRSWEFVLVNDRKKREKLLRVTPLDNADDVSNLLDAWGMADKLQRDMYLDAIPRQFSMLYNAGCLILPFFRTKKPLLQPESLSSLNPFASIWCCIENMLVAAASEGIFGVTRIPMADESEHIRNVLGHPNDYVMPCYVALGYPAEEATAAAQIPVSAKAKIHLDTWQ